MNCNAMARPTILMNIQGVRLIECDICLGRYREGQLELHQESCIVRLVFRCSICNEDYVSREGLLNHLYLHEIVGDSKDMHFQELQAKFKLHQCSLCNDHRGYSESSFGIHVRDFHGNCDVQNQTIATAFNILEEEPVSIKVEDSTSDSEKDNNSKDYDDFLEDSSEADLVDKQQATTKLPRLPRKRYWLPVRNELGELIWRCPICNLIFDCKWKKQYHMTMTHTEPKHKCSYCQKMFHLPASLRLHIKACSAMRCHKCGIMFTTRIQLKNHISKHPQNGTPKNVEALHAQDDEQAIQIIDEKSASKSSDCRNQVGNNSNTSTNSMENERVASPGEPRHKCSLCQKMFKFRYKLRKHEEFCSGLRCYKCGIMFSSRVRLEDHNITKHSHVSNPVNFKAGSHKNATDWFEKPGASFLTTSISNDQTVQTKAHIAIIIGKILRWVATDKITMPVPHVEVRFTECNRATAKCWHCSRPVVLNGHTNKDGSMYWFISNFRRHILSHLRSTKACQ